MAAPTTLPRSADVDRSLPSWVVFAVWSLRIGDSSAAPDLVLGRVERAAHLVCGRPGLPYNVELWCTARSVPWRAECVAFCGGTLANTSVRQLERRGAGEGACGVVDPLCAVAGAPGGGGTCLWAGRAQLLDRPGCVARHAA